MVSNAEIQRIESAAEPHILRCRPGDWEHAKRVAKWVVELGEKLENLSLVLTAAYIHDIGWRDLVSDKKITFDQLLALEPQANKNSEPFVREVLGELGYSDDDIKTVLRLVAAADKHESAIDDEAVIVDADSLSKLDINHLREKFPTSEWMRMYELWERELSKRVKRQQAKAKYPELLKKLKEDIQKEP
jgi:hypothetical protein